MSQQVLPSGPRGPRLDHPATSDDDSSDLAVAAATMSGPRWGGYGGLMLAPLGIAALAGILAIYHNSLQLDPEKNLQQASALDWSVKLWPQMRQHLEISAWSTLLVVLIAVPLGILLTRPGLRRAGPFVLAIANSGQALPAYGLLILFLALTEELGMRTVVMALVVYAILPVLRNTMVGLDNVERSTLEAGRGMGMTRWRVLTRIELPLAVPVILAGVRVAMVINIGMATLAFLIGGGGLGITIASGLKLQQDPVLIVGAGLVAVVALTFDWIGAVAERVLKPKGL